MKTPEIALAQLARLESLVDAVGFPAVLSMLAAIAYERSYNLEMQNHAHAQLWENAGKQLDEWSTHAKLKDLLGG